MKYIIFFGLLILIFLLHAYRIREHFDTITKIKRDNAIETDNGFYETAAPETKEQKASREEKESVLAEKTDYRKALNDYNVEYHDSAEKIADEQGLGLNSNIVWVFDEKSNKKIAMKVPVIQNIPTFYKPGEYKYGASSYVPSYTESILLSKKNGLVDKTTVELSPIFNYYDINQSHDEYSNYILENDM